ncbi:patatin-like phospholipase family protein [Synechococcus sp. RSCCF101]|uniref:patatin-like phospholipase family protein n=1 Tax=Synechococcus sp. RSCCF101 TaxID=2511069 RepID=UPI001CD9A147|nr:patatin-like phospholipase family protein [Synechococcus sp. RSCCF101]
MSGNSRPSGQGSRAPEVCEAPEWADLQLHGIRLRLVARLVLRSGTIPATSRRVLCTHHHRRPVSPDARPGRAGGGLRAPNRGATHDLHTFPGHPENNSGHNWDLRPDTGAFGAGVLAGWSEAGDRPDFKIVTGISTGSLQATFAFLGPEHDADLAALYTRTSTEDIYTERDLLSALLRESMWDTAPLQRLLERHITSELLDAVAARHARGHRLFVGTANMDTDAFTIWDMGAIASSGRPDRLERYRQVLLASASIPVLFPPVYFPVQIDGRTYHEMHVDGGIQAQLFLRGFMLDIIDGIERERRDAPSEWSVYLIRNGWINEAIVRDVVEPSSIAIASATIDQLVELSNDASLFRAYMLAERRDLDFHLAAIPDGAFPGFDALRFDTGAMQELYDFAYNAARTGYDWEARPPSLDRREWVRP